MAGGDGRAHACGGAANADRQRGPAYDAGEDVVEGDVSGRRALERQVELRTAERRASPSEKRSTAGGALRRTARRMGCHATYDNMPAISEYQARVAMCRHAGNRESAEVSRHAACQVAHNMQHAALRCHVRDRWERSGPRGRERSEGVVTRRGGPDRACAVSPAVPVGGMSVSGFAVGLAASVTCNRLHSSLHRRAGIDGSA